MLLTMNASGDLKTKLAGALRWIARIGGTLALVLGVLLWLGMALAGLRAHMIFGGAAAGALALIALLALGAKVRIPLAVVGLVWAGVTLYVGFNQSTLMTGDGHWVIEIVHALLGIGTIGMAEALAAGVARAR